MRINSTEHFHERRLSRTILPNHRMDFASVKVEGHSIERTNTWKGLRDVAHLKKGCLSSRSHWKEDFGLWSWSSVSGLWSLVFGLWTLDFGLLVFGLRSSVFIFGLRSEI